MLTNKEIRRINKAMRAKDQSDLFPIKGKFNATERAIRNIRKLRQQGCGGMDTAMEYSFALEGEISAIVNSQLG